jgi:hypothetical protein
MPQLDLQHAKDTFVTFRVQSVWVRSVFDTRNVLLSAEPTSPNPIASFAPDFFDDLTWIFTEYWILIVCRLTDPAESNGRENLTAELIVQQTNTLKLCTAEIRASAQVLQEYRSVLNKVRHRHVAHMDKKEALDPLDSTQRKTGNVDEFLLHLQLFNDLVSDVLGEGRLDFKKMRTTTDVQRVVSVLRDAA